MLIFKYIPSSLNSVGDDEVEENKNNNREGLSSEGLDDMLSKYSNS